jgi:hypothetical protein
MIQRSHQATRETVRNYRNWDWDKYGTDSQMGATDWINFRGCAATAGMFVTAFCLV